MFLCLEFGQKNYTKILEATVINEQFETVCVNRELILNIIISVISNAWKDLTINEQIIIIEYTNWYLISILHHHKIAETVRISLPPLSLCLCLCLILSFNLSLSLSLSVLIIHCFW